MALNIFEKATVIPAKGAAKATGKKSEVFTPIEGLANYAAIDALIKALEGLKATARGEIDPAIKDKFVTEGVALGREPENFKAKDGNAEASIQLKKRSSASGLDEAAQALLARFGISTETVQDRPETFIINPDYADLSNPDNRAKLEELGKFLEKKGWDDLIQKQEATTKVVTTDNSLNELFTKKREVIEQLLTTVGTVAIKAKLNDTLDSALDTVRGLLVDEGAIAEAVVETIVPTKGKRK